VTDAGADVLTRAEGKLNRSREGVLALLPDDERACFLQGLARLACAHQDDLPACCAAASDS
jgi:hypothetical protein